MDGLSELTWVDGYILSGFTYPGRFTKTQNAKIRAVWKRK